MPMLPDSSTEIPTQQENASRPPSRFETLERRINEKFQAIKTAGGSPQADNDLRDLERQRSDLMREAKGKHYFNDIDAELNSMYERITGQLISLGAEGVGQAYEVIKQALKTNGAALEKSAKVILGNAYEADDLQGVRRHYFEQGLRRMTEEIRRLQGVISPFDRPPDQIENWEWGAAPDELIELQQGVLRKKVEQEAERKKVEEEQAHFSRYAELFRWVQEAAKGNDQYLRDNLEQLLYTVERDEIDPNPTVVNQTVAELEQLLARPELQELSQDIRTHIEGRLNIFAASYTARYAGAEKWAEAILRVRHSLGWEAVMALPGVTEAVMKLEERDRHGIKGEYYRQPRLQKEDNGYDPLLDDAVIPPEVRELIRQRLIAQRKISEDPARFAEHLNSQSESDEVRLKAWVMKKQFSLIEETDQRLSRLEREIKALQAEIDNTPGPSYEKKLSLSFKRDLYNRLNTLYGEYQERDSQTGQITRFNERQEFNLERYRGLIMMALNGLRETEGNRRKSVQEVMKEIAELTGKERLVSLGLIAERVDDTGQKNFDKTEKWDKFEKFIYKIDRAFALAERFHHGSGNSAKYDNMIWKAGAAIPPELDIHNKKFAKLFGVGDLQEKESQLNQLIARGGLTQADEQRIRAGLESLKIANEVMEEIWEHRQEPGWLKLIGENVAGGAVVLNPLADWDDPDTRTEDPLTKRGKLGDGVRIKVNIRLLPDILEIDENDLEQYYGRAVTDTEKARFKTTKAVFKRLLDSMRKDEGYVISNTFAVNRRHFNYNYFDAVDSFVSHEGGGARELKKLDDTVHDLDKSTEANPGDWPWIRRIFDLGTVTVQDAMGLANTLQVFRTWGSNYNREKPIVNMWAGADELRKMVQKKGREGMIIFFTSKINTPEHVVDTINRLALGAEYMTKTGGHSKVMAAWVDFVLVAARGMMEFRTKHSHEAKLKNWGFKLTDNALRFLLDEHIINKSIFDDWRREFLTPKWLYQMSEQFGPAGKTALLLMLDATLLEKSLKKAEALWEMFKQLVNKILTGK